jgi:hypothetical protein
MLMAQRSVSCRMNASNRRGGDRPPRLPIRTRAVRARFCLRRIEDEGQPCGDDRRGMAIIDCMDIDASGFGFETPLPITGAAAQMHDRVTALALHGARAPHRRGREQETACRPLGRNSSAGHKAASMANHASTRTTQLYDRRSDEVTLDEVERVGI